MLSSFKYHTQKRIAEAGETRLNTEAWLGKAGTRLAETSTDTRLAETTAETRTGWPGA